MSESIIVRVTLDKYDMASTGRQTQVYVQIPEVARVSWLLPAEMFHPLKDRAWPEVLDVTDEHIVRGEVASNSSSTAAWRAIREWLAQDANRDEVQVAFEKDRARRDLEPVGDDRAKAPWGRSEDGRPFLPPNGHWTDIPELVDKTVSGMQSRLDKAQGGHWYDASLTETWRAPGTVCTRVDGAHRNVGQFTARPADLDFVLHAHDDLSWCLGMIAKLRARVAELESERHSTNEALDDAVAALRARETASVDRSADKLTALFAPTQALREDPHDGPLHHDYRVGRDLPEMGGA